MATRILSVFGNEDTIQDTISHYGALNMMW